MLYGGFAPGALHNKFLMAKASSALPLMPDVLPAGFEMLPLPGHSYDMTGFRTPDDVVFLADCLSSNETLEKYQIGFLYDVASYLDTLERVKGLSAAYFVPSHAPASNTIADLAQINIDKTLQIVSQILDLLADPIPFEDLLAKVFQTYHLTMTLQQRVLVGSTIKSYLAYLVDLGKAAYTFCDHYMLWSRVS